MSFRHGAVFLCALLLLSSIHANADTDEFADTTDQSDSATDMAIIGHGHDPDNQNLLRHMIHFDGSPDDVSELVSIFFRYRRPNGARVRRELQIRSNPDGGLYGSLRSSQGSVVAITRAWMEDPSTLFVEFPKGALGPMRGGEYRWFAWSILGAGEFGNPCAEEDTGPPVCRDRAPATGVISHQL